MKRGSLAQRLEKYKAKPLTSDEYTSEYPSLDGKKTSESSSTTVVAAETLAVTVDLNQHHDQQLKKSFPQEKKTVMSASKASPTRNHFVRTPIKKSSEIPSNHQDQKNSVPQSSSHNKNSYIRPSTDSPVGKEKNPSQINNDNPSVVVNPNFFKRKPQQSGGNNQQNNSKQQNLNGQGHNQQHSSNSIRGRNFHQQNNNSQQYNRDRYFAKGSGPPPSTNSNYDQQNHISEGVPTSAGTGRTRHSGGNQNQFNNQKCKYFNIV